MSNDRKLMLNERTDFTPVMLLQWMKRKFGEYGEKIGKSRKQPFRSQDIHGYQKRGFLPPEYGGHSIQVITNGAIGIRILRIKDI